MPKATFIPPNVEIPVSIETDRFRLQMLLEEDARQDYMAVMESRTWPLFPR